MMTTREKLIYLFWVLLVWWFAYWKRILLVLVGVALVVWLLVR